MLRSLLVRVLLVLCLASGALAQGVPGAPDLAAWEKTADRVEKVLAVNAASDTALENLRAEVVDWREQLLQAKTANASRRETLVRRLAALPTPPAEGETEPEAIAAERAQLEEQRRILEDPAIKADLAYTHADGLVREIDRVLRERQASQLIRRWPTPLNPLNWSGVLGELVRVVSAVPSELAAVYAEGAARNDLLQRLPVAAVTLVVGFVLLLRSGGWTGAMMAAAKRYRQGVSLFLIEALAIGLQLVLPVAGWVLIIAGISLSGALGTTGNILLQGLGAAALSIILGVWLVARIYPNREDELLPSFAILPTVLRQRARRVAIGVVVVLGLNQGLTAEIKPLDLSEQAEGYLRLIVVVLGALALYRLSQIYRARNILMPRSGEDLSESRMFTLQVVSVLALVFRVIAIAGPVLGFLGYLNAAKALVIPACSTYLLIAVLTRLQQVVAGFWVLANKGNREAGQGLWPTLLGGMLYVLALPSLSLIWGARPSDLREIWIAARDGFNLGGVHLSPGIALQLILVLMIGGMLTRFVQGVLSRAILPKTRMDTGAQRAITSGAGYVGVGLALLVAITSTGLDLSNIAIVAGALSVGIGFGLQTIVSNFVSGIILLVERPVSEGDWIEVNGQMGIVKGISVRSTRIETFDRTDVIVPNADFVSGMVTNYTRGKTIGRLIIPVGVAYGNDTRKVDRILRDIAEAHPMVLANPAPNVAFMGFGADSLDFEIRVILRDVNWSLAVRSEINHQIYEKFVEEKIEIPFAQRDIWIRNPEALQPQPTPAAPPAPTPEDRRDWAEAPETEDQKGGSMDQSRPEGNR